MDFNLLFTASFFIFGLNYAVGSTVLVEEEKETIIEKNILWFVGYYGDMFIPEFWTKPLYNCVMCMASFWGSLFYVTFTPEIDILKWGVFIVVLAGLNRLLKSYL